LATPHISVDRDHDGTSLVPTALIAVGTISPDRVDAPIIKGARPGAARRPRLLGRHHRGDGLPGVIR
jgi:hypothetical protein